jgi:beta-glucosidase/6-phospho-beta-glucosidase/beta-galactosidase
MESSAITGTGARLRLRRGARLRYGPPLHTTLLGPGRYDWEFADDLRRAARRDIRPIVDLCHFGVPDWIGDFQNPDFPALFADYARAFAERFPWVQLYTPVNEMFICAPSRRATAGGTSSSTSDRSFVTALKHIVKANVLAMRAILEGAARRDLHPERVARSTSTPRTPARSGRRDHERASASCRSTSTTAAASTRRCTSTCWTTA